MERSDGKCAPVRQCGEPKSSWSWPVIFGLLTIAYVWFFPYYGYLNNPNENVRIYLTKALVDSKTIAIGEKVAVNGRFRDQGGVIEEWGWVNDKAILCTDGRKQAPCAGPLYAAKAPGMSFLGIPAYLATQWTTQLISGRSPSRAELVLGLRLLCAIFPALLFLVFFRRYLIGVWGLKEVSANLSCVALSLGTMAYPYSRMFAGHQPAALALGMAFILLHTQSHRNRLHPVHMAVAGLLLGAAPAIEYPAALPGLFIGLYGLYTCRKEVCKAAPFILAGLVPVVLTGLYHQAAFGSPLATPYDHLENVHFIRDISPGTYGIHLPAIGPLIGTLFSPEAGLFFHAPWLILIVPAMLTITRNKTHRLEILVLFASVMTMILFLGSMPNWRVMLGWTAGPRYIAPMGIMASILAAAGMESAETPKGQTSPAKAKAVVVCGLVLLSVLVVTPGAISYPHYPMTFTNPTFQLAWPLLLEGYYPANVGNLLGLRGHLAALPGLVSILAVTLWAMAAYLKRISVTALQEEGGKASRSHRTKMLSAYLAPSALAILLALALFLPMGKHGALTPAAQRDAAWVRRQWTPSPPKPEEPCLRMKFHQRRGESSDVQKIKHSHPDLTCH